jgi:hypothetical protein
VALSAFLLFAVQPAIARPILPWFGGSSAVWSTCMLFFQIALLPGYLYAYWLNSRFWPTHAYDCLCDIARSERRRETDFAESRRGRLAAGSPSLRILALLAATIDCRTSCCLPQAR